MSRELLIVGTSGLSKEAAQLARRMDPHGTRWHKIGYVTHLRDELGTRMPFGEVCELDETLAQRNEAVDVVIGIGHPNRRRDVAMRLSSNAALDFPNLIHPTVEIDDNLVSLGRGNMVTQGVVMTCDIHLGDFNLVNWNSTIGHDSIIGSYNVINPGSSVSGRVRIGDACLLGTGCRVLETLQIASGVTVGSGAVVTRSILQAGTYLGVPARRKQP
jgi:sugar O-acyltransferase (sialic acid O-acetyltransferase NeuD family)